MGFLTNRRFRFVRRSLAAVVVLFGQAYAVAASSLWIGAASAVASLMLTACYAGVIGFDRGYAAARCNRTRQDDHDPVPR